MCNPGTKSAVVSSARCGVSLNERGGTNGANHECGRAPSTGPPLRRGSLEQAEHDVACDLYAETYVNPFGTGPAARVEPIRRYHDAFPDLRIDIDELIATADTVVLRSTFRGTDTGGYAGRPPTGRAVDEWVMTIMHFERDKVVREWIGADKLGLFIQLGVVDDPWPT
jgi:predicted ester cyclase